MKNAYDTWPSFTPVPWKWIERVVLLRVLSHFRLSTTSDNTDASGIFGKACLIFKLHGNVPHAERNTILRKFRQGAGSSQCAALLLATDVAARGLNLPGVDWMVQYDRPWEIAHYDHCAGRTVTNQLQC